MGVVPFISILLRLEPRGPIVVRLCLALLNQQALPIQIALDKADTKFTCRTLPGVSLHRR